MSAMDYPLVVVERVLLEWLARQERKALDARKAGK